MSLDFTSTEFKTIHNKDFFYVKASATKKIQHLFADVRDEIKKTARRENIVFPKEVDATMGKIFRGENYLDLPYLVLDYPKHFSKESVFAFRTMFWWGNFFSFTMHLQGKALEPLRKTLIKNLLSAKVRKKGICICVHPAPWNYHYKKDNYVLLDSLSGSALKKIAEEKEFIKLSRKIPLKDHKKVVSFSKETFLMYAGIISSSSSPEDQAAGRLE